MPQHRARRTLAALTLTLLTGALAGAGAGLPAYAQGRTAYDGNGAVRNILPPGSNGTYNAAETAGVEATGTYPPNSVDQLRMYDALNTVDPAALPDDLSPYYKDGALDPVTVVSTSSPKDGVTIKRDDKGVPFVYGTTLDNVAYGAGYAGTQDRMFLQDLLRHVGAARMVEFLGDSPANRAMDQGQLRTSYYTREEAAAQITNLPRRYPQEGPEIVSAISAFVAGINDAQRALCPANSPTGPDCPADYAALQITPTDWTPADVVYVASLVGGIFGKGGGGEDTNARWLQQLQASLGPQAGRAAYEDLRERSDPEAPVTISTAFPYGAPNGPVDPASTALPSLTGPTASGTGAVTQDTTVAVPPSPNAPVAARLDDPDGPTTVDLGPLGTLDLGLHKSGMSNALVVGGQATPDGHPVAVFGPQTGYFSPQLLTEISLQGPGVAARGASFAGTQAIVELGHGVDYAWSATSASGDNVDIVADRLCNPDGSAPTVESTAYVDASGACTPLDARTHTETAKPTAAGSGGGVVSFQVLRTRHGIVQKRVVTTGGVPVALVTQRSTYGKEFDSVVGFRRINNPDYVRSAADFQRAFAGVDYTFHWFYADSRDIGYVESGLLPLRAPGVDPDFPRFGDARWDWTGFLGDAGHPQAVDPPQGYFANWNNNAAPQFQPNDAQWAYGPVYRSLALSDRIRGLVAQGRGVTPPVLTGAMIDAATVDSRAFYTLPQVLAVLRSGALTPEQSAAVNLLQAWLDDGAHRVDRDRTGGYSHQPAIALFDTWWDNRGNGGATRPSLAKDVLRGTLGGLVDQLPKGLDDHPRQGVGSSWNGVPWYGYVNKDLRQVLGRPVAGAYSRTYCGGGTLTGCQSDLAASLTAALQRETTRQGSADLSTWTYDKSQDFIRHVAAGVVGVPAIDWQNRPTFQQVVRFTDGRSAAPGAVVPEAPYAVTLPLLTAAGLAVHLRRRRGAAA